MNAPRHLLALSPLVLIALLAASAVVDAIPPPAARPLPPPEPPPAVAAEPDGLTPRNRRRLARKLARTGGAS